jgi:hypothetical protein
MVAHVVKVVQDIRNLNCRGLSAVAKYKNKGGRIGEDVRAIEAAFLIAAITSSDSIHEVISAGIKYKVDLVFTSQKIVKAGYRSARFDVLFHPNNPNCRIGWELGKEFRKTNVSS